MNRVTVYGIANCDTVKRARAWLVDHGVEATFHDFKKAGVPIDDLDAWMAAMGWERLLNRQGTTWRKLDDSVKATVHDHTTARSLMLARPSVIRRPVVRWPDGRLTVGFDADDWARRVG